MNKSGNYISSSQENIVSFEEAYQKRHSVLGALQAMGQEMERQSRLTLSEKTTRLEAQVHMVSMILSEDMRDKIIAHEIERLSHNIRSLILTYRATDPLEWIKAEDLEIKAKIKQLLLTLEKLLEKHKLTMDSGDFFEAEDALIQAAMAF